MGLFSTKKTTVQNTTSSDSYLGGTGGTGYGGEGGDGGTGYGGEGGQASATGGTLDFNFGQNIAPSTHVNISTEALAAAVFGASKNTSDAIAQSAAVSANNKAIEAKAQSNQIAFFSNVFQDTKKGAMIAGAALLALYLFKK